MAKRYENAEKVKQIFADKLFLAGDTRKALKYKLMDLDDEDNRQLLAYTIKQFMEIYKKALKELEG